MNNAGDAGAVGELIAPVNTSSEFILHGNQLGRVRRQAGPVHRLG
jgi:hypothetical protein